MSSQSLSRFLLRLERLKERKQLKNQVCFPGAGGDQTRAIRVNIYQVTQTQIQLDDTTAFFALSINTKKLFDFDCCFKRLETGFGTLTNQEWVF